MSQPALPSIVFHVDHLHLHLGNGSTPLPVTSGTDECCANDRSAGQDEAPRRGRPPTNGKAAVNRILVGAGEPIGAAEVHRRLPAELDVSPSAVKNWLAQLVTDGLASYVSGGKYTALGQLILPAFFVF